MIFVCTYNSAELFQSVNMNVSACALLSFTDPKIPNSLCGSTSHSGTFYCKAFFAEHRPATLFGLQNICICRLKCSANAYSENKPDSSLGHSCEHHKWANYSVEQFYGYNIKVFTFCAHHYM